MAVNDNITLAKGSYSVTLPTFEDAENIKNSLTLIPGVTSVANQISSPNLTQVVDLLRLTHTWTLGCYITSTDTKTAKQIKDDLIIIAQGARTDGGSATLTYEDDTYPVYVEDLVIKKTSNDDVVGSGYTGKDSVEYTVTLTLVEGEEA